MPVVERDPWRLQYFEGVVCPPEVFISTKDADSYTLYPKERWIYNKLLIAESQGLLCGPHGIEPPRYPVFSKPMMNLKGMGVGSVALHSEQDYSAHYAPGHMWMEFLSGEHVSTDVAVRAGVPVWWRHTRGIPAVAGTFDYWIIEADERPDLVRSLGIWIQSHLPRYTGMLNFETIGGPIIEAHLRFADQWPDLYGTSWVDALVGLYVTNEWTFSDTSRQTGYSVVLFMPPGPRYRHPPSGLVDEIRSRALVSSVQITFHEDRNPDQHAMPPGGFRVAIINCTDLDAGKQAREDLRRWFESPVGAQTLR